MERYEKVESVQPGIFARSKAGHDKGEVFVIISQEDEYVYLVDGKNRPLTKPKKKKMKHIQPILKKAAAYETAWENGIKNEDIRRIVKSYKRNIDK